MRKIDTFLINGRHVTVQVDEFGARAVQVVRGHEYRLDQGAESRAIGEVLTRLADERDRLMAEVRRYQERIAAGLLIEP